MSRWPGKYVIGLTGNIATGKSVVRKMLEHLGAYGIDADALVHQAMMKGAPAYPEVVRTFGEFVLGPDGQIDRKRLGGIVFASPDALARLEAIVHPIVGQAVDVLARRTRQPVVVVEAIKLLESELRGFCDSVWVVDAPESLQVARMMRKRGMSEAEARQRIAAQPPQGEKLRAADVAIPNYGSFEQTWMAVLDAWNRIGAPASPAEAAPAATAQGTVVVRRGKPSDATAIADFVRQASGGARRLSRDEVMAAFGDKAYMLAQADGRIVGLMGWKVENLVTRTDEIYAVPESAFPALAPPLLEAIENASRELQCEVSLVFVPPSLARNRPLWSGLGYELKTIQELGVRAWQEAARESRPDGAEMLVKRLREDRVLRPV